MPSVACLLVLCGLVTGAARGQSETTTQPQNPTAAASNAEATSTSKQAATPQVFAPAYASPDEAFSTTSLVRQMIRSDKEQAVPAEPQPDNRLTRQLWQSRIAAPDPNEDAETRESLARLIRQIRSVQFEPSAPRPTFSVPAEPVPADEPPDQSTSDPTPAASGKIVQAPVEPITMPTATRDATLPTEVSKALQQAIQDPNQVRNPLEMAELLFLSDRPVEAAVLYQKALERVDMGAETAHEDRAWILFQIGNCLRETNMTKAKDMYVKLIAEYPDCPWAEPAKAHGRLINWYQQARPQELTARTKP